MSVKQPTPIQDRIVGHGTADPAALIANPRNWRTHPPEQRAALVAELERVGWVQSVIVNRTTGHLVDGHLRVEVAAERREPTIPVVYVELTEAEEARVLVALDPLGSMAGTNDALLQDLLDTVDLENDALERHLVSFLAGGKTGRTEPDDVPPVPEGPAVWVQPGDLWLLGDHRLLCGDATRAEDVDRLCTAAPRVCFTDPPWNVAYGTTANPRWRERTITNDDLPADEFAALLGAFAALMARRVTGDVYVVMGSSEWPTVDAALRAAGLHWSATIIWVKDQFTLGRSNYQRRYEPIWYGWRRKSSFTGDRALDDVWEVPRPKRSDEHPTMKPVALVSRALVNSSLPGDVILDPFLGSGSTLIAAESLGRTCFGIDIEPRYVQVAIERWQAFTGREAVRG